VPRQPVGLVEVPGDAGYDLLARVRYDVFGEKEACMVPDAGLRERFLATDDGAVGGEATADATAAARDTPAQTE
jgi:hypothetical protein